MRDFMQELKNFFRKGDMVLLILCLATSAFGCLVISSTTNAAKFGGSIRYIVIQIGATVLGVMLYAIFSSIDAEFFSEHRLAFTVFNIFLILLLIPFGTDNNTGNYSWLKFPLIPFYIQPAEICKIFYILIMASVMASHQNHLSGFRSIMHMALHLGLVFGVNVLISRDLGVSLVFAFIFVGMAFAGGLSLVWFLAGGGFLAIAGPVYWTQFMTQKQKDRILYLFIPEQIDPKGLGVGWHTAESLKSLTGGGMTGQGLFNGNRTQSGQLFAQHTDFVFSSIGEELGFIGCALVLVLLLAIIARCIWVGHQSSDMMRRLICYGAASALIFQVIINVGMCIGVMPVIGITLPLISYGGSSIATIYMMLGLVSGVHARPSPRSHERYIQPPRW